MEPDEIEARSFDTVDQGFDPGEVQAFIKEIAEEVRVLRRGGDGTAQRYRLVGEQTSRILLAAEEAGERLLDQSRHDAAEIIADARSEAARIARAMEEERRAVEADLGRLRDARAVMATQLEDVQRRLEEMVSRLRGEIDAWPAAPARRRKPAEEGESGPTLRTAPAPAPAPAAPPAPGSNGGPPAAPAAPAPVSLAPGRAAIEPAVSPGHMNPAPTEAPPEVDEGVAVALRRRDQALGEVPDLAGRRLKRLLQEDQNAVLDRLRTLRGKRAFDQSVSPEEEQFRRFADGLAEAFDAAFRAGRAAAGGAGDDASPREVIETLVAKQIVGPLRRDLARVVDAGVEAGDTPSAIAERCNDVFRVWKGVRTHPLGEGLAHAAYHHGLVAGWRERGHNAKRWAFASDEGSCPKDLCTTNASAGPVPLDAPFPSGHLAPPAHGACTCTLLGPG